MKPFMTSGAAIAALLLSGCASMESSVSADTPADANKQYFSRYDHSLKPAPSVPLAGTTESAPVAKRAAPAQASEACVDPASDSTLKLIARLEASAAAKGAGSAEHDASVMKLAERTQMLAFLRESLYRTCERRAAGQISKEEAAAAYDKVMDSVHAIIETDRDRARESAAKALKDLSPEQIKALK